MTSDARHRRAVIGFTAAAPDCKLSCPVEPSRGMLAGWPGSASMKRRDVIASIGAAALACPLAARAQQPRRLPVVAIVSGIPLADMVQNRPTRSFLAGLRDLGWIEGRTVQIERRSAEGSPERAPAVIAELVARGVDVIFLGGTSWLHTAAHAATKTTPLVALFSVDPVAAGLIASLARPGGNMTGITRTAGPELYGKWFQLLQELAPHVARTAFLADREALDAFRNVARPAGIAVIPMQVDVAGEVDAALAAILCERADSMVITTGPQFYLNIRRLAAFAAEHRLPALYAIRDVVEAGGLMSYGPSVDEQFRQVARYVDKILKGAKPADLPVEQPTKFELVINAKAAAALGLTIPPTLLALAGEAIE
jgi:putative ABC transport system substrate-binding protein